MDDFILFYSLWPSLVFGMLFSPHFSVFGQKLPFKSLFNFLCLMQHCRWAVFLHSRWKLILFALLLIPPFGMCLNKRHQIDVVLFFCLLTLRERHTARERHTVVVRVGPPPPPPVVKYSSRLFSEGALRLHCVGFNSVCVVIRSRFNGFAFLVVFKMCFKCRWKINPRTPSAIC